MSILYVGRQFFWDKLFSFVSASTKIGEICLHRINNTIFKAIYAPNDVWNMRFLITPFKHRYFSYIQINHRTTFFIYFNFSEKIIHIDNFYFFRFTLLIITFDLHTITVKTRLNYAKCTLNEWVIVPSPMIFDFKRRYKSINLINHA